MEMTAYILERFVGESGDIIEEIYHKNAAILLRQSRIIRHDDRQVNKSEYYKESIVYCPSCGAEINLNSQEVTCPYCNAIILHQFFDWQVESFDFYDKMGNTGKFFLLVFSLWGFSFLILGTGLSFYNISWIISLILIFAGVSIPISLLSLLNIKQNKLKKKIIRYSESYLRSCINEELWKKENKEDLLSFNVNKIKLNSVWNKDEETYIKLKVYISRTFLKNTGKLLIKKENLSLCMKRAKYPSRIKSRGEIYIEKECPSCGANFMPDKNNNCSYCGYGLQVYNGKWKIVE